MDRTEIVRSPTPTQSLSNTPNPQKITKQGEKSNEKFQSPDFFTISISPWRSP
ncbi:hypothetical protein LC653_24680 [Nostoc sp. CHAB 5784]|uniref:hypothetical protein n=1 Tax=Nostoc mirabile TaxID=2907820 RepID=UPI001E59694F|nr:hypothetical protein [Nostoc mirabile]MCC5666998.1 hypothetical protein [Nostoc mirabile CHAB5784]